jgi:hypothetical protein
MKQLPEILKGLTVGSKTLFMTITEERNSEGNIWIGATLNTGKYGQLPKAIKFF